MDVHMGHFDMGPIWDPPGEPNLLLISSFINNLHFYLLFTDAYQMRPIDYISMKF